MFDDPYGDGPTPILSVLMTLTFLIFLPFAMVQCSKEVSDLNNVQGHSRFEDGTKFKACAKWPEGVVFHEDNTTRADRWTFSDAEKSVRAIRKLGMDAEKKIWPIETWVEITNPKGEVTRVDVVD